MIIPIRKMIVNVTTVVAVIMTVIPTKIVIIAVIATVIEIVIEIVIQVIITIMIKATRDMKNHRTIDPVVIILRTSAKVRTSIIIVRKGIINVVFAVCYQGM